jgi:drug/metabolite transporter (DMT)-like permease
VLGLALGLSASLCWGVADFLGGVQTRRAPAAVVVLASQAVGAAGLLTCALITADLSSGWPEMRMAFLGGLLFALGLIAFYEALSIGTMSVVAPVTATGAAVPVLVGLAGGERPGAAHAVGMLAAALGVLFATQDGQREPERRRLRNRSIGLALVAAVCIGGGLAAYDGAADSGVLPALTWGRLMAVAAALAVAVAVRPRLDRATLDVRALAALGVADVAATALFATATTSDYLSVVAVAASVYPAVTVALARLVLGERLRARQAAGIAVALAGVTLLAAG